MNKQLIEIIAKAPEAADVAMRYIDFLYFRVVFIGTAVILLIAAAIYFLYKVR